MRGIRPASLPGLRRRSRAGGGDDSLAVLSETIDALARRRTAYWPGDSAGRLHALTSLIAQAERLLPQAIHHARGQELTWNPDRRAPGHLRRHGGRPLPEQAMINLARITAVTERIGLTTAILIGPYRGNGALLAKQLATVDAFAEGRLQVGIAVGGRADDYEATGTPFAERGRAFDAQLAELRAVWAQQPRGYAGPIGPAPVHPGGPPLLIGGNAPAAFRRLTEYGAGWIMGGGGPEAFTAGADQARRAWREAGRAGAPRLAALAYASLGDDAEAHARAYLTDYYSFTGEFAEGIAASALTSPSSSQSGLVWYRA